MKIACITMDKITAVENYNSNPTRSPPIYHQSGLCVYVHFCRHILRIGDHENAPWPRLRPMALDAKAGEKLAIEENRIFASLYGVYLLFYLCVLCANTAALRFAFRRKLHFSHILSINLGFFPPDITYVNSGHFRLMLTIGTAITRSKLNF